MPSIRKTGSYSLGQGQIPYGFSVTFQNGQATEIHHRVY
jgi:hypothetical protein